MRKYSIQLADHRTGEILQTSGGVCFVATASATTKATLYNADGSSLANPVSLSNGLIEFHVADTVNTVDLYGMAPGGQFFTLAGIAPSGPNEINIDQGQRTQVMVIPFSIADTAAATETATGFTEPANAVFTPDPLVRVTVADATETVDVGTDSTDSGDANGFIATLSVGSAATVAAGPTVTTGSNEVYFASTTTGALLADITAGTDAAGDVGTYNPKVHVSGSKSITYTLTAGSDTAAGFIIMPYFLTA